MPKGELFLFFNFSKGVLTNDEKLESVASFPNYMTFICGVDSENRTRSLPLNKVKKCTTDRYTSKKHFVRMVYKILQFIYEKIS